MKQEIIVKVQVPLASSEADAPALVYNKRRTVQFFMPVEPRFKRDCAKTGKAFYRVKLLPDDKVEILERVEDQPW